MNIYAYPHHISTHHRATATGSAVFGVVVDRVIANLNARRDCRSSDRQRRVDIRILPHIVRTFRRLSPGAQRRALELMIDHQFANLDCQVSSA